MRIAFIIVLLLACLSGMAQEQSIMEDSINEVVVVGYGTQTRNQLTKSVSSIRESDINRLAPVSMSVQDILSSGLASGVLAVQNTGAPGAAMTINVRGVTSAYLNMSTGQMNNAPLFVIDGVPTYLESTPINPILDISPYDIESIDVLKDAAATAIYGSRGANGVIMIKTKEGKRNLKPRISLSYTFSSSSPAKRIKPLNNAQYLDYQTRLIENGLDLYNKGLIYSPDIINQYANLEPTTELTPYGEPQLRFAGFLEGMYGSESIDWEKEITNFHAPTHNVNFSIEGGTAHTIYNASIHGIRQEGTYKKDVLKTWSGNLGITTDISKYVRFGLNGTYSESKRNYALSDESFMDTPLYAYPPDKPVYDNDGNYTKFEDIANMGGVRGAFFPTPVAMLERRNVNDGSTFFTNGFLEIRLPLGLKFRSNFGYNKMKYKSNYFNPIASLNDFRNFGQLLQSNGRQELSDIHTTTVNFQLDYHLSLKKHDIQALVGFETERSKNYNQSLYLEDFPNDYELSNAGSAKLITSQGESFIRSGLNSWFSRISYALLNKYFADLSFRADGSSKFGPNNRWAFFPAISAGWMFSRENFLKDVKWIDNMKLRASFGKTGSANIDDFAYEQFYNSDGQYDGRSAISINDMLPNRNIKWEKTREVNLGYDFSFFKHRLYGNLDVYWRKTDGSLAPSPHISESGLSLYFDNIIDLTNRGFEFTLGGEPVNTKDVSWNTILNISRNKSKIDKLNNAQIDPYFQDAYVEGKPVGVVKGYVVDHIAQTQEEIDQLNAMANEQYGENYQRDVTVGDLLYKDINGNGIIDDGDRVVIADPEPDFFGSWYNQINYKNFALSFNFVFAVGGHAYYTQIQRDMYYMLGHSISPEVYKHLWSPDNPNARFGKPAADAYNMASEINDHMVYSTSFLRMKNITLSYQLPEVWSKKIHVSTIAVYMTLTNLFTITSWPGLDPETTREGVAFRGQNIDPYPLSRTLSFGVNVNF